MARKEHPRRAHEWHCQGFTHQGQRTVSACRRSDRR
jgi:hypothetical protein